MSYSELPAGAPSTKKAVISIWFRVPHTSIAKAQAEAAVDRTINQVTPPPLHGVIPIMVLGPQTKLRLTKTTNPVVSTYTVQHWAVDPTFFGIDDPFGLAFTDTANVQAEVWSFDGTKTLPIDPTYIGIDCRGDYPRLNVQLVMPPDNTATYRGGGIFGKLDSVVPTNQPGFYSGIVLYCQATPDGFSTPRPINDWHLVFTTTTSNDKITLGATPEIFSLTSLHNVLPHVLFQDDNFKPPQIIPDHWHHLLLSFDLEHDVKVTGGFRSGSEESGCSADFIGCDGTKDHHYIDGNAPKGGFVVTPGKVNSACKMYVALDDQNLTGTALSAYIAPKAGPNDVLTINGYQYYNAQGQNITITNCLELSGLKWGTTEKTTISTYSFTPVAVPFVQGPLACPASPAYVNQIKHIELAELQVFTDTVIDTGIIDNRRAFITDKGKPASMSKAANLIGKDPEIKLHGSGNWKKARNTGTFNSFKEVGDGDTLGEIDTYHPNPSLNGKQGDPQ